MFSILRRRRDFTFLLGVITALAGFTVAGTAWAVDSKPVTVVNPADIAKAEGIQNPHQAEATCIFIDNLPFSNCDAFIETPASQRLVIEFVSGACLMFTNNNVRAAGITTSVGGNSVTHILATQAPTSVSGFQGGDEQEVNISQQVRIYADAHTTIHLSVTTWNSNNIFSCGFSVSGQAVTVP
jgi:hypothetical protein